MLHHFILNQWFPICAPLYFKSVVPNMWSADPSWFLEHYQVVFACVICLVVIIIILCCFSTEDWQQRIPNQLLLVVFVVHLAKVGLFPVCLLMSSTHLCHSHPLIMFLSILLLRSLQHSIMPLDVPTVS